MILVTGASGRVGSHVVRALRAIGEEVRALVRRGSEYFWLNETGCRYFFGDLRDPDGLRRACRDARYLVVASGVRVEARGNDHRAVTVEGHAALFRAALERGVERVVLVSCLPVAPGVAAFDARARAERALVESGLDYTILRAAVHEELFARLALQVERRGRAVLPAPGHNSIQPVSSADVGRAAAACLDHALTRNRVVELAGPERMGARHAFEIACEVAGVEPRATVAPPPAVAAGRTALPPVRRYAHRLAEVEAWFRRDTRVDVEATARLLGFRPEPFRAALPATIEHLRVRADRERRWKAVKPVHFGATVYQPGVANLDELPDGPPPRRD